jgi:hypothetical protein
MSATNGPASTQPLRHAPPPDRAVPAHARQLAAQLSALFDRDVEIVKRLNNAQRLLASANERLRSGLAPDPFGLTVDHAGAAAANSHTLEAVKHAHRQIHRGFCQYQSACEERRQLAFDVGELSQQLTQALGAAGWTTDHARHTNVHELASTTT